MSDIFTSAEDYAWGVIRAVSNNPATAKFKAKIVRDLIRDARLLGALDSAERILGAFQYSKDILEVKDAQEMKDLFLGELHIYIKDLQNHIAKQIGKPELSVKVEDLIKKS